MTVLEAHFPGLLCCWLPRRWHWSRVGAVDEQTNRFDLVIDRGSKQSTNNRICRDFMHMDMYVYELYAYTYHIYTANCMRWWRTWINNISIGVKTVKLVKVPNEFIYSIKIFARTILHTQCHIVVIFPFYRGATPSNRVLLHLDIIVWTDDFCGGGDRMQSS